MTQISISFYALIIFFSLFLVVTNGRSACNRNMYESTFVSSQFVGGY
ncbi:Nodule Cysteine-Rich (NCR) secreted peptide [Medicago truncatula]|uniref:Nodule Cysteine-Rich (NCR) secreted peptide n=1 Tax=Medicago truncatula TaxID=3880 RepID=A0A072VI88_MEDTR|nr:Nodule Cysteine-Rich (NCR) secreted peptide [Medicago truncatula]